MGYEFGAPSYRKNELSFWFLHYFVSFQHFTNFSRNQLNFIENLQVYLNVGESKSSKT